MTGHFSDMSTKRLLAALRMTADRGLFADLLNIAKRFYPKARLSDGGIAKNSIIVIPGVRYFDEISICFDKKSFSVSVEFRVDKASAILNTSVPVDILDATRIRKEVSAPMLKLIQKDLNRLEDMLNRLDDVLDSYDDPIDD